jgi:hypothetical protein
LLRWEIKNIPCTSNQGKAVGIPVNGYSIYCCNVADLSNYKLSALLPLANKLSALLPLANTWWSGKTERL